MTLIQQYLRETIGFMNPTLYALGQRAGTFQYAAFHDVTQGDNLYYSATSGWDFGTGWGSMDGTAFLNDLVTMGGPIIDQPVPSQTPPPIVQPTPSSGSVSYHVVAHWEKAGSKGGVDARPLTTSKKGTKVQLGLYFEVDSAQPSLPVTASFSVIFKGKSVAKATVSGRLDDKNPTGTYSAAKTYTPSKKGVYTFLGKVSMGGQVVARAAALTVK
jgi:hypothetical protein